MKEFIPKYLRSRAGTYAKVVGNGDNDHGFRTYVLDFIYPGQTEPLLGGTVYTLEDLEEAGVTFLETRPTDEELRGQEEVSRLFLRSDPK